MDIDYLYRAHLPARILLLLYVSILYLWQATGTDSVADPDPAPRCQNYLYWRLPVRTVFRIRILLLGVKIISVARYRYGLLRIRILHWSVKKIPGISITYRNWQDNYCISCTGMFSSLWKEDFFSFSTGYVKPCNIRGKIQI